MILIVWFGRGSFNANAIIAEESKVGDLSRGSLFDSYYTEVLGKPLLHSLHCSTLPLILTL